MESEKIKNQKRNEKEEKEAILIFVNKNEGFFQKKFLLVSLKNNEKIEKTFPQITIFFCKKILSLNWFK